MKYLDISKVSRVEVIDDNGRAFVLHNCSAQAYLQDDDRTLKVFVKNDPSASTTADMAEGLTDFISTHLNDSKS